MAAAQDAERRAEKAQERAALERAEAVLGQALAPAMELERITNRLVREALTAAGYHCVDRKWRRKRHASSNQAQG